MQSQNYKSRITLSAAGLCAALMMAAPDPAAAQSVTFSASPSCIAPGKSSTLSWQITNLDGGTCSTEGFNWSGDLTGTATVSPTFTTTYEFTCVEPPGVSGGGNWVTTVSVPTVPPTVSLSANQTSIAPGMPSTLTWSAENAATCAGTNFDTGGTPDNTATSGSATVTPTATTTYTVTCACNGTASQSVTVAVTAIPLKLSATLQLGESKNAAQDGFALESSFTLPSGGTINPSAGTTVTLSIGSTYTVAFPANSFKAGPAGSYYFDGSIGGVQLAAAFVPTGQQRYIFTAGGLGASLSTIPTNQQDSVTLTVGNYSGTVTVKPLIINY